MKFSEMFNFESPVWKFLGYIWDALTLTLIWMLFSLPILTIGASTTALYTVTLRMMRQEEGSLFKDFFQAFKSNMKQGMTAGILFIFFAALLGFNIFSLYKMSGDSAKSLLIAVIIFAYVFLMIFKFIFPVIARFSNSFSNLLIMSFILSVKNFGWTLLMIVLTLSIIVVSVFVFWPLIFFSVGAIALLDSWVLDQIFSKYIAENNIC